MARFLQVRFLQDLAMDDPQEHFSGNHQGLSVSEHCSPLVDEFLFSHADAVLQAQDFLHLSTGRLDARHYAREVSLE